MLEKAQEYFKFLEKHGVSEARIGDISDVIKRFEKQMENLLNNVLNKDCDKTPEYHWYLVATAPQELSYWKGMPATWTTEVVESNTVTNVIDYDGVSEYNPPEDNMLAESQNVYVVGDLFHG